MTLLKSVFYKIRNWKEARGRTSFISVKNIIVHTFHTSEWAVISRLDPQYINLERESFFNVFLGKNLIYEERKLTYFRQ